MAECNTCGGYLSIEDKIRLSMKCDANGNVVWQGELLNQAYDPETDENLLMWTKSRSGLSLIDEKLNNLSILTPYVTMNGTDDIFKTYPELDPALLLTYISGNFCEAKILVVTGEQNLFFSISSVGHAYKRQTFEITTAGKLRMYFRDGTNARDLITNDAISAGWHTVRVESTGAAYQFTVDGSIVAFTVTIGFDDGIWGAVSGVNASSINIGGYVLSGGTTFAKANVAHIKFGNNLEWDCNNPYFVFDLINPTVLSGDGMEMYSMQPYGTGTKKAYGLGSSHCLDKGFSIFTKAGSPDIHVPNKLDGAKLNTPVSGYVESSVIYGNITDHNLADSKIRFVNAFFDRSNATIWNDDARLGYYDAANTKDFHQSEINFKTLIGWLNDGYAGMLFPKVVTNSITDRDYIDEILLVSDDRTLQDEVKVLTYTGDIAEAVTDESGNYVFDDLTGYVLIN